MLLTNSIIASYASVRWAFSQAVLAVLCMIDVVPMSTAPSQHHCTLQIANFAHCKLCTSMLSTAPTYISCILTFRAALICSQFVEHCTSQIADCTIAHSVLTFFSSLLQIANRKSQTAHWTFQTAVFKVGFCPNTLQLGFSYLHLSTPIILITLVLCVC